MNRARVHRAREGDRESETERARQREVKRRRERGEKACDVGKSARMRY